MKIKKENVQKKANKNSACKGRKQEAQPPRFLLVLASFAFFQVYFLFSLSFSLFVLVSQYALFGAVAAL